MGNEEDWEEDCVFILDIWVVFAIFFLLNRIYGFYYFCVYLYKRIPKKRKKNYANMQNNKLDT